MAAEKTLKVKLANNGTVKIDATSVGGLKLQPVTYTELGSTDVTALDGSTIYIVKGAL